MKTKYIVFGIIFAVILKITGFVLKSHDLPGASALLTISTLLIVLCLFLGLWKVFQHSTIQDFMNK